jgi:hypothetical protein
MLVHELAHVRERGTMATSFSAGLVASAGPGAPITSAASPAWFACPARQAGAIRARRLVRRYTATMDSLTMIIYALSRYREPNFGYRLLCEYKGNLC